MTEPDHMTQILANVEKTRKKIAETLDRFYMEIEGTDVVNEDGEKLMSIRTQVIEASTTEEIWNARDRMEELRSGLFKLRKSSSRNFAEASEAYYDSMRADKARGAKDGHYEEREARYEIKNISEYKIMRNLERTLADVETFSFYFEGRLRWVKDRLRWVRENEQWSRMKY